MSRILPVRCVAGLYPYHAINLPGTYSRAFFRIGHPATGHVYHPHQELPVRRYLPTYPCVPGIFPDWVFRWQPRIPFPCSFGFPGSLSSGIVDKEISADIPLYPGHSSTGPHIPFPCSFGFPGSLSPGIAGKEISAAILPVSRALLRRARYTIPPYSSVFPGSLSSGIAASSGLRILPRA